MLRWCAWCQKYIGEAPPLDDFTISHGVCDDCEGTAKDRAGNRALIDKSRDIRLFFQEIHASVRRREFLKARELLEKAAHLGIDDTSLVFGILQPTLRDVGLMWEAGSIDVGQEHAYTAIVGQTLELLSARSPHAESYRQAARPAVLLACVNDNYHSVGIRMLEYYLAVSKVPSYVLAPGVPAADIAAAAAKLKPPVLGLSIALSSQAPELENIRQALAACPEPAPAVYFGGAPVRKGYPLPAGPGFTPLADFNEFLKIAKGAGLKAGPD